MLKLEHANLSCTNSAATTRFIQAAFPEFTVRGAGTDQQGRSWCHIGNEAFYLALSEVENGAPRRPYDNQVGMNHLGWEVDDVDQLEARMTAAGFAANLKVDSHPARKRRYFYDPDGNDWEFVQYTTDDLNERNDYSDANPLI